MQLKHREIEELQRNLRGWVAKKRAATRVVMKTGYGQATRLSIYRYHRGDSQRRAQQYLTNLLDRLSLKNESRRDECSDSLVKYIRWREDSNLVYVQDRLRLGMLMSNGVLLGGEIPLINLNADEETYQAIMLGENAPDWRDQLRMPILQAAVAQRLERKSEDVVVGTQSLDGSRLDLHHYTQSEITEAVQQVIDLTSRAQRMLAG
jgi:hypothetical protein